MYSGLIFDKRRNFVEILQGTEETVRVVSMDKDFHVDCYICEVSTCILQMYSVFV